MSEFIQGVFELKALLPQIQDTVFKSVAGGYLNYEFGWKNLVQDLSTLSSLGHTITDRIEYLKRTYGIPQRLGFSREISLSSKIDGHYDSLLSVNWGTRLYLRSANARFRATTWVLNLLDNIDGFVGLMRALLGATGFDNPVKAVWNIIPFSFVVDWFAKISSHLDAMTRIHPAIGWNVYNTCWSVSMKLEIDVFDTHPVYFSAPYQENYCGGLSVTWYERSTDLPVEITPTVLNDLSPQQLSLLIAMLGTT